MNSPNTALENSRIQTSPEPAVDHLSYSFYLGWLLSMHLDFVTYSGIQDMKVTVIINPFHLFFLSCVWSPVFLLLHQPKLLCSLYIWQGAFFCHLGMIMSSCTSHTTRSCTLMFTIAILTRVLYIDQSYRETRGKIFWTLSWWLILLHREF